MHSTTIFNSSLQHFYDEVKIMPEVISLFSRPINFLPLVLIVEDDEDTRTMMTYLLKLWHYRVVEAVDGEEGLQMAENLHPDIILMDYNLPKIDGLITTRRIRELPMFKETPVIFISAFSESAVRASALAAGADDFLIKPLDFGQLEKSLDRHLKNGCGHRKMFIGGLL